MRRVFNWSVLGLAAVTAAACSPDTVIKTEDIPTAGVRFINAVPDTAAMDMRWVDLVENNAHWGINYRNNIVISPTGATGVPAPTLVQYKGARAGQRHFRIFMNGGCNATSCNQAYASTVVVDTIVSLVAGRNYTALLWAYANPAGPGRPAGAPLMRLDFIEEDVPDPGPNVALRVINASMNPIDVRYYASGGSPGVTADWANVAGITRSAYITTAPGQFYFNVQPAGGGAALATDRRALLGADAVTGPPGPFDAIPGTTVAGSAVTAIFFPAAVPPAPQTGASASAPAFTSPTWAYIWDRRPPRPAGT